jgi:hypothetical protein
MINLTYTGSCTLDGIVVLCTSMSSSLDQKVSFYDHTLGLRDKFAADFESKGESSESGDIANVQKRTYRYSPALAKASISGPVVSDYFQYILDKAVSGEEITMELVYFHENAPVAALTKAVISSLNITLKAGEVASFSLEAVAAGYSMNSYGGLSSIANCVKLVTWDVCRIKATPILSSDFISSFNITINNPTVPIYTARWTEDVETNGMMPQKIRIGIQEVTGNIGIYGTPIINAPNVGEVEFSLDGAGKKVAVAFNSPSDDGSTGPYIRSINFSGVNNGTIWSATGN